MKQTEAHKSQKKSSETIPRKSGKTPIQQHANDAGALVLHRSNPNGKWKRKNADNRDEGEFTNEVTTPIERTIRNIIWHGVHMVIISGTDPLFVGIPHWYLVVKNKHRSFLGGGSFTYESEDKVLFAGRELKQEEVVAVRRLVSDGTLKNAGQSGCYVPAEGLGIKKRT